jgi:hypothetical protein
VRKKLRLKSSAFENIKKKFIKKTLLVNIKKLLNKEVPKLIDLAVLNWFKFLSCNNLRENTL